MTGGPGRRWLDAVLVAAVAGLPGPACLAIDNPDAPDRVAEFRARAQVFERRIGDSAGSLRQTETAYAEYERFLDGELSQAYRALAERLGDAQRISLEKSQRRWLAYRDAEFRFIDDNWTLAQFGTSAALSRGAYRASILRDRAIALLQYLKNYRQDQGGLRRP